MFGPKELVVIVVLAIMLLTYFIPTVVAMVRKHHNTTAIFVLNLFLGWSLLGWVAALVWAVTKPRPSATVSMASTPIYDRD
ncbi:MAG: superinfection immunity protein [Gammaproteobacteria bacterium]|nr:superinfection immunity protein [Gammaproteobacteria bacterium]